MPPAPPDASEPRWAAVVRDVTELSLVGDADAATLAERLAPEGLAPLAVAGRAQVRLLACAARFLGRRFRELSLSVAVEGTSDDGRRPVFLLGAFTSSRFFAICERAWFSTPYLHGAIALDAEAAPAVTLARGSQPLLRAARAAPLTGAARPEVERLRIHLPSKPGSAVRRWFAARLEGSVVERPFAPADALHVPGTCNGLVVLHEAGFRPRAWRLARGAVHARSRTWKA